MSVFSELKRRNVIRMAGLYLVGAWLLIQIAETLLPIFRTPEWVLQAVVVLLALGLLPALVFSWLYELTPEGLKRDSEVDRERSIASLTARRMDRLIVLGLVAVVAVVAADRYWPRSASVQAPASTATAPAATDGAVTITPAGAAGAPTNSIAVLPFVNMSSDPEQAYFSDGLSEELLNLLAQLPQLKVIARTSSFSFKDKDLDVASIAAQLNVAHVLEGSVRKSGDTVRITAQLIRAADSSHLWSQTFDRTLTDIFKVQDEIAAEVVAALKLKLMPDQALAATHGTRSTEAYEAYLRGKEIQRIGDSNAIELAVGDLEHAIALDPEYAQAHALLAFAQIAQGEFAPSLAQRATKQQHAMANAEKAVALAPDQALGYAARSLLRVGLHGDWRGAERDLSLALALAPNDAEILSNLAWTQRDLGRHAEALPLSRKAAELDPLSGFVLTNYGLSLLAVGRVEEARTQLLRAIEVGSKDGWPYASLGRLALDDGDIEGALAYFRQAGPGHMLAGIAMAEHARGDAAASQRALDELVERYSGGFAYQVAEVHAFRGDREQALTWLETCFEQRDLGTPRMRHDPDFAALREEPRFQAMLGKLDAMQ